MSSNSQFDAWSAGQNYEHYMGRWSRQIASTFLEWLGAPANANWLEIGCGTGALTAGILDTCSPRSVIATDPSAEFVDHASRAIRDQRVRFDTADAQQLPVEDSTTDVVTSALVLNFVPDKVASLKEMQRTLKSDGLLSFYVWDYPSGGMGFIDTFWKAAIEIDPSAADLDEGARFAFCTEGGLRQLCEEAGLPEPTVVALEATTVFPDFEAYWSPFTLGAGPAPGYCMSLTEDHREKLKARLAEKIGKRHPINLIARAWAVKAHVS